MTASDKRDEVINLVHERLNNAVRGVAFEVVEAAVRRDNGWWYVPVMMDDLEGRKPTHDILVNLYANVEEDVSKALKTNVLLVPSTRR